MGDPDPAKARRVTEAMLKMSKIDIAALKQAHEQGVTSVEIFIAFRMFLC